MYSFVTNNYLIYIKRRRKTLYVYQHLCMRFLDVCCLWDHVVFVGNIRVNAVKIVHKQNGLYNITSRYVNILCVLEFMGQIIKYNWFYIFRLKCFHLFTNCSAVLKTFLWFTLLHLRTVYKNQDYRLSGFCYTANYTAKFHWYLSIEKKLIVLGWCSVRKNGTL